LLRHIKETRCEAKDKICINNMKEDLLLYRDDIRAAVDLPGIDSQCQHQHQADRRDEERHNSTGIQLVIGLSESPLFSLQRHLSIKNLVVKALKNSDI